MALLVVIYLEKYLEADNLMWISISKEGESCQEIKTEGCLILYVEGDKIKMTGEFEAKALAPMFMKFAMEKLTSKMQGT